MINLHAKLTTAWFGFPFICMSSPLTAYLTCKFFWTVTYCLMAVDSTCPCRWAVIRGVCACKQRLHTPCNCARNCEAFRGSCDSDWWCVSCPPTFSFFTTYGSKATCMRFAHDLSREMETLLWMILHSVAPSIAVKILFYLLTNRLTRDYIEEKKWYRNMSQIITKKWHGEHWFRRTVHPKITKMAGNVLIPRPSNMSLFLYGTDLETCSMLTSGSFAVNGCRQNERPNW